MTSSATSLRSPPIVGDALFLIAYTASLLVVLALVRGLLLYINADLAADIPPVELVRAFFIGVRFDLIVTCLLGVPLVMALLLPRGLGTRRLAIAWLAAGGLLVIFAGVVEPEFYREFHTRLNSIAFHYLSEDAGTVSSMIWNGYPVVRYVLLWLLLGVLYVGALLWAHRATLPRSGTPYSPLPMRIVLVMAMTFLVAWGARGTLRSGPPLRWGDAFHSPHLFANHLALNGSYTLAKAAMDVSNDKGSQWLDIMPAVDAQARVRDALLTDNDELLSSGARVVLRRHSPLPRLPKPPRNVVLIIMESFSGAFTGALGSDAGITPAFDRLASQGLLFDHFFSNGTHTHQGMFATGTCFPNLPGHEYLMQQPEGQHQFSGLPVLLDHERFDDVYVYNGHFAWDNQEGFFRNQGMTRFVGRDDMHDPVFIDSTWGVSDQDMFDRALEELDQLSGERPFYAILQTLSNHTPYALPEDLPVEAVKGFGNLDDHLTAQRYADWALGRFFDAAARKPWFKDTLFVLVGDHGFPTSQQVSPIDLLRFRVPLLLMGPGVRETYGAVNSVVATQTDVVPTIVGLLGEPFVHQCWGRDLLALPVSDPGFGVIKPSGSDQTVALVSGDRVLVRSPDSSLELGRYHLSPQADYQRMDDPDVRDDLSKTLLAYVQVAMRSLRDNLTGIAEN
ncbi:MAG: LTA synthase family protein [Gammaproteobacteria bacterium]|nr:LTA synthase family protein [Gammaproteobacteria bacterium]